MGGTFENLNEAPLATSKREPCLIVKVLPDKASNEAPDASPKIPPLKVVEVLDLKKSVDARPFRVSASVEKLIASWIT